MNAVKNGLILWFNFVLPALFPFMISINLLKETPFPQILSKLLYPLTGKFLGLSSYGVFALISGLLSGYPLGAKLVSELYTEKKISKGEASYLLSFTNNSGPLFIIGTVGTGLLSSRNTGFFLLMIHYLSAFLICFVMPKPKTKISLIKYQTSFNTGKVLRSSIYNAIEAIVTVGGYIVFFSIICTITNTMLQNLIINPYIKALIYGFFEITNGCSIITQTNRLSLSIISAIIAFGGLSIHSQSIGYISSTDLSVKAYLLSKTFQGAAAFAICFLLFPIYAQ